MAGTGQGKTLTGLLMLQAQLNSGAGPTVYLCPNNFLVEQTCEQADQFGIGTCKAESELPDEFENSKKILVTTVQKLFNGLTKFGLNTKSIPIGTLLMDDAHACADIIREACRIRIPGDEPAYHAIKTLFDDALSQQGLGTYADINNHMRDALLPVPYWAWIEREAEVAKILSSNSERKSIKFAWPILKNYLGHCQCVVSGGAIEIEPYIPPLEAFGSYSKATHRIFMSATVTDDSFLVKGLQLQPNTIINPLTFEKEKWSGEKMVLLPSLIDEELTRSLIVKHYAKPNPSRLYGVVSLAPSFNRIADWESYGSTLARTETVSAEIQALRDKKYEKTLVLVNRYDGIDLPDNTCRILIFDGKPYSESLIDLYEEICRPESTATLMRTVRTVEQGMGRSVRGEKDYSVIIIIGPDIIRLVRDRKSRKFLSPQMSKQVEIGLSITDMAQEEIRNGEKPNIAFRGLINQCLGRDADWKDYYKEQMKDVRPGIANQQLLDSYATELAAELSYINGDYGSAVKTLQQFMDAGDIDTNDKGWYLQQMARYSYISNRVESQKYQISAHSKNRLLLKPSTGVTVSKLTIVSQGRIDRIGKWLNQFENYSQLEVVLSEILNRLIFGVNPDAFEQALDEISRALGFAGERPDKEWKEGPDNLWALDATHYILWECKNEVEITRSEINKREAEQMNRSSAWFDKHYAGSEVKRIIIHPTHKVANAAAFTHEVEAMRVSELTNLCKKLRDFFKSFESSDFNDLSATHIQELINAHNLSVPALLTNYSKKLKNFN